MKLYSINLILSFIFIFFFIECINAKEISSSYKIEVGSLNVGTLKWKIDINKDNYKILIQLKNKGLITSLYKFSGEYHSEGKIVDGFFISNKYIQNWKTKKKYREINILFKNKKVVMLEIIPEEKEVGRINFMKLNNLTDPISSFVNIIKSDRNNLITIDGRRIYKMNLDKKKNKDNYFSKKIIISEYANIWTDHKRNDLKYIIIEQILNNDEKIFPKIIKIKNKGIVFKLTKN